MQNQATAEYLSTCRLPQVSTARVSGWLRVDILER
jgi:hypothetical protein